MDDFNTASLHESKNEWGVRLINIMCPLVIEGFRSIFEESCKLCKDNGEMDKYLMTFQNFIARIPKWNATIVAQERKRIVDKSGCTYLEELVTCVHIVQLKILTTMRVGQKQKKIDINIPKLDDFIHKAYVNSARKLYKNVYLFEIGIAALQMQKNHREMEMIVQECILNAVRESIPVESILRAYMEESVEEELVPAPQAPQAVNAPQAPQAVNAPHAPQVAGNVVESLPSVGDKPHSLKFNDNDSAISTDNHEEIINAPKTIERLEEISDARYNQRKMEAEMEEDEDKIKISDQNVSITDCVDLNAVVSDVLTIPDLVLDFEELPF